MDIMIGELENNCEPEVLEAGATLLVSLAKQFGGELEEAAYWKRGGEPKDEESLRNSDPLQD